MIKNIENPFGLKKSEGDLFEEFSVQDINEKTGLRLYIDNPNKKFEYWDLIDVNDDSITVECKNDKKGYSESNNVCIEYGQYSLKDGKRTDSGIVSTRAKFWLQCNDIQQDDCTIYLAYSSEILKLFNNYMRFCSDYNLLVNTYDGVELNKKLDEFKNDSKKIMGCVVDGLYPIKRITHMVHCLIPQANNQDDKPMDLFLIPKDIYKEYCLEVNSKHNMTYRDLK